MSESDGPITGPLLVPFGIPVHLVTDQDGPSITRIGRIQTLILESAKCLFEPSLAIYGSIDFIFCNGKLRLNNDHHSHSNFIEMEMSLDQKLLSSA